jgi:3-dehydroquinate dehydratase I
MRPTVSPPLLIRDVEFGGPKPLFCVPLVAKGLDDLLAQAKVAREVSADVVEWRADFHIGLNAETASEVVRQLRNVLDRELLIFTLRIKAEGGNNEMNEAERLSCILAVLQTAMIDFVDIELVNSPSFIQEVRDTAKGRACVIMSFHDFSRTPDAEFLLSKISDMVQHGADIAKIACMPQNPEDVLRLLDVTLRARKAFPSVPLCTMSMGGLGRLTRVAGFLCGSDMAFAVGREVSAPGQIPIEEARGIVQSLLRDT